MSINNRKLLKLLRLLLVINSNLTFPGVLRYNESTKTCFLFWLLATCFNKARILRIWLRICSNIGSSSSSSSNSKYFQYLFQHLLGCTNMLYVFSVLGSFLSLSVLFCSLFFFFFFVCLLTAIL